MHAWCCQRYVSHPLATVLVHGTGVHIRAEFLAYHRPPESRPRTTPLIQDDSNAVTPAMAATPKNGQRAGPKVAPPPLHFLQRRNRTREPSEAVVNLTPGSAALTESPAVAPRPDGSRVASSADEQRHFDIEYGDYNPQAKTFQEADREPWHESKNDQEEDWDAHAQWLVQQLQNSAQMADQEHTCTNELEKVTAAGNIVDRGNEDGNADAAKHIGTSGAATEEKSLATSPLRRGLPLPATKTECSSSISSFRTSSRSSNKAGWEAAKSIVPLFRFSTVSDSSRGTGRAGSSGMQLSVDEGDDEHEDNARLKADIFRQVGCVQYHRF